MAEEVAQKNRWFILLNIPLFVQKWLVDNDEQIYEVEFVSLVLIWFVKLVPKTISCIGLNTWWFWKKSSVRSPFIVHGQFQLNDYIDISVMKIWYILNWILDGSEKKIKYIDTAEFNAFYFISKLCTLKTYNLLIILAASNCIAGLTTRRKKYQTWSEVNKEI